MGAGFGLCRHPSPVRRPAANPISEGECAPSHPKSRQRGLCWFWCVRLACVLCGLLHVVSDCAPAGSSSSFLFGHRGSMPSTAAVGCKQGAWRIGTERSSRGGSWHRGLCPCRLCLCICHMSYVRVFCGRVRCAGLALARLARGVWGGVIFFVRLLAGGAAGRPPPSWPPSEPVACGAGGASGVGVGKGNYGGGRQFSKLPETHSRMAQRCGGREGKA
jgi:hypothetical protein